MSDDVKNFLRSYRDELQSAYLYEVVARTETHPQYIELFRRLGGESRKQADIWAQKLKSAGYSGSLEFYPSTRALLIARLVRAFGARALLSALASMKVRGLSVLSADFEEHSWPPTEKDERNRHRGIRRGANLRAAVFGVNDGLLSNVSLVLGVAGATTDSRMLMLSGLSGLLAGAFSMAAGEYISVRSQRELYEYQIDLERAELAEFPQEEAEELALIYEAKGIKREEARAIAQKLVMSPDKALDTLAREELGLNPNDLGSPIGAALASFLAFAVGAVVPVVPFLVSENALKTSVILSASCLFVIGASLSLFTGRSALWSGLRMLLIALVAGAVTYSLGYFFATSI